jgi:hypothetical protein
MLAMENSAGAREADAGAVRPADYAAAWQEWNADEDAELWERTAADGLVKGMGIGGSGRNRS